MEILKIKDLEEGQTRTIQLVVLNASTRQTASKKPYLAATFFDGQDQINGNQWDFYNQLPLKNVVYDVTAQVQVYQGNKQLNIKDLTPNSSVPLTAFMPDSGKDLEVIYAHAFELIETIEDPVLHKVTSELYEALHGNLMWVPGAKGVHHAFVGGTLVHSVSTADIARSMAVYIDGANMDLVTAGALLHDIGKLWTYQIDGITIEMTDQGMLHDHIAIGHGLMVSVCSRIFKNDEEEDAADERLHILLHVMLSHHGSLEYGSPVTPVCLEALIVHAADGIDAKAQTLREAAAKINPDTKWTDKIWSFDNRPVLNPSYVQRLFSTETAQ